MTAGEYSINVPTGTHKTSASKPGYIYQSFKNIKVLEDQTSILNFELKGGDNMEHIVDINITNCDDETIQVPDGCATKSYNFIGVISGNPVVDMTVELLTADGTTVLQTQTTDTNGIATFTDVIYGNYKLREV